MSKSAAAVFAAVISVILSTTTPAQQIRIPDFPELPLPGVPRELGTIMQMQMTNGSSRSISMTVENGVKKINASENGLRAYIEEDPDGHILIKVTRQYTSDQLDLLMDDEPELYMHLKSIPTQTDTAEVEVSVGVTRTCEADDLGELEKNHPEAFDVYQQFTSGSNADLQRLQEFPRFMIPELRGIPMPNVIPLEIQPGDIRIHPQPDDRDSGNGDDKDQDT